MKPVDGLRIAVFVLILTVTACRLPIWVAPAPTLTPVKIPTPTSTATPAPTCIPTPTPTTFDLEADVFTMPLLDWMDRQIWSQFPSAEMWVPKGGSLNLGIERNTRLYRIFEVKGEGYMAVFELTEQGIWTFLGAVKMGATPTPSPAWGQKA